MMEIRIRNAILDSTRIMAVSTFLSEIGYSYNSHSYTTTDTIIEYFKDEEK